MTDSTIKIHGPFPPPTGLCGPNARKTASHVYQIFDASGCKLIGGTSGPDTAFAIARAKKYAAEKGLIDPEIIMVPAR